MSLLPIELPEIGRPVKAVIKFSGNWNFVDHHILTHVDEDDVTWRDEDNAEAHLQPKDGSIFAFFAKIVSAFGCPVQLIVMCFL